MAAPQQFYCDMTTDGGGWVLVAKGRNGWTEDQSGTGDESQLTDTSFDGFESTYQLPAERIDQLLDGEAVANLADPIRLRRATDTAGSAWQEVRFKTSLVGEGQWTWSFGGGLPLQWFGFDGSQTNTTSRTANFGNDNGLRRVDTRREDRTGWDFGFAYGSGVTGTLASDSYLLDKGDPGYALPFTLMYLRPQVSSDTGFSEIPDTGTGAIERRLLPQSDVDPMPWGVTGIAGSVPGEGSVEVQAFVEADGRMYVGGNFRWVQRDGSGTGRSSSRSSQRSMLTRESGCRRSGRSSTIRFAPSRCCRPARSWPRGGSRRRTVSQRRQLLRSTRSLARPILPSTSRSRTGCRRECFGWKPCRWAADFSISVVPSLTFEAVVGTGSSTCAAQHGCPLLTVRRTWLESRLQWDGSVSGR